MYICLCHGVTDEQVEKCIAEGARSLDELKSGLGVAAGCGKCTPFCEAMLDEACIATNRELKAA
jgi:bacterioferritin-associated ferredoxin